MGTIANPDPVKVISRAYKCMCRLMEAGITFDALQMPIDDPEMRKRLVNLWSSGGYEPTTSQKLAREIMGEKCFFGFEEAIRHFKVRPTEEEYRLLAEVPFIEGVLREYRDTHILIAVFPLSILDIRERVKKNLFYSHRNALYNDQAFAKDKGEIGWHLVRKNIVPSSTRKTRQEQQALLPENEEIPSARVMTYTIIGHYKNSGERLFKKVYARCQCLSSHGSQVNIGVFDSGGLGVGPYQDGDRSGLLGFASSLKIQSLSS